MSTIQWQWLRSERSLKEALQNSLGCSGQLLKKHFSSKELARPQEAKGLITLPLDLVNNLQINPIYTGAKTIILKETSSYIAIHKPPAVHCHPHRYGDQDTILNFLVQEKKWDVLDVNKQSYDRGLLYRLDYETSGVLLIAKNEQFFLKFRDDFQSQMKRKLYWVIVEGSFNKEGEWTHYFLSTGLKGSKQKVTEEPLTDSRSGTLSVKKIMESQGKSLLLVNLQSGLRHQIRAQLAYLGSPILGDELYGGGISSRLFLHAWRYEWDEYLEDNNPDLFGSFFDLDSALKMSHDMVRRV